MKKMDISDWKHFLIEDLFIKLDLKFIPKRDFNKGLDISESKNDEFNLPLVNAKHNNNGIMYYGRSDEWESEEMTIDIVADGAASTGDVYAQPQRTGVLYNAYLIKPINSNISKESLLFLATVIQKCIKERFGYDNKCTWDKVKKELIILPVSKDGNPDFDFMNTYMSKILKSCRINIENLKYFFNKS